MNGAILASAVAIGAAAAGGCVALAVHATVAPRLHAAWVRSRTGADRAPARAADDARFDLADLLDAIGRSVRSGSSVAAALVACTSGTTRLPTWLDDAARRSRMGIDPAGGTIGGTARSSTVAAVPRDHEGRIAARALALAGASRHGPLEHGASLIRLERSLLAERRAAVAPVRASVRILTLAPIAILSWLAARSPEVRAALAGSPAGTGAVLAGIALNVAGRSWMGRIVAGAVR